jgi:hypothetical protein
LVAPPAGVWPHVLVVEQITPDSSIATYAWGIARRWGFHRGGWSRVPALFVNGALQLKLQWSATVIYRTEPDGTLSATYERPGGGRYRTSMRRIDDKLPPLLCPPFLACNFEEP